MTETPPREFTGRDLVEALQEASRVFGVRRSELGYEMIEANGVGARGCVIRAWPRANARPQAERAPRDRDFDRPPRSAGGGRPDRGPGGRRDDRERGDRGPARGPRRSGFGDSSRGGPRRDLPETASRTAPPERSRGGMYDDALPARLSDRAPGQQRDERPRRGGMRRRDDRGGTGRGGPQRGGRAGAGGGRAPDRGYDRGPERSDRGPERGDRGPERSDRGPERSERGPDRGADWGRRGGQGRREPRHADGGSERRARPPRDRDGARGPRRDDSRRPGPPQERHHHDHEPPKREPTVPATDAHAAEVRDLLEEVIDRWGMDLHVSTSVKDDTVSLSLDGADAALLSADDGRLLDSLQYLVSKMTSRLLTDNVRVLLDAAGFRNDRDQALRNRAIAVAHEALDGGRKLRLDPLNPYERRVVHLSLKEIPGIRTYSIGRGYLKRVTIEPLQDEESSADDDAEE